MGLPTIVLRYYVRLPRVFKGAETLRKRLRLDRKKLSVGFVVPQESEGSVVYGVGVQGGCEAWGFRFQFVGDLRELTIDAAQAFRVLGSPSEDRVLWCNNQLGGCRMFCSCRA